MHHSPDSEPGCAPIWALCHSGTAAHSRARPRSRPCPAQVTHPRRRQVANFCRVISRQLRRLTGSRADSVSSCHGHHRSQAPLRPPQSLPAQPATSSWPAPSANLSTVSGATRACGVPGGDGHLPDPRLLAADLDARLGSLGGLRAPPHRGFRSKGSRGPASSWGLGPQAAPRATSLSAALIAEMPAPRAECSVTGASPGTAAPDPAWAP